MERIFYSWSYHRVSFPASWGHMHYANAEGGYPLMATTFVFDFVPEDFLQSSVRVSVTQMP